MSCDWDRARRLEIRYYRQYHPDQAQRLGIPLHLDNVHKYQRWLASIPRTYLFEGGIQE